MKKVGFIGGYKKTDLLLYIAKMLIIAGKKVLVVDTTIEQRAKYIVPSIDPTFSYITNYEDIDVAIGFKEIDEIQEYLASKDPDYDYALIDIDRASTLLNFEMLNSFKNYFVTTFDLYSIKKGLDFLSLGYKIKWDDYRVYFPFEMGDESAIIDNQRLARIKFKNLSPQYKESLMYIAEELLGEKEVNNFIKALKNFEKGE